MPMEVELVEVDGIFYEYGLECGEGQDMCVWQLAPNPGPYAGDKKRKQICSKHYELIMAEAEGEIIL